MASPDDVLDDLVLAGHALVDDGRRWSQMLRALEKVEVNAIYEEVEVNVPGDEHVDIVPPNGEVPIYNHRYRPSFAVGPEYQQYVDDAALLAWDMLREHIFGARKFAPIVDYATKYIDANYCAEQAPEIRAEMCDIVREHDLPVSPVTQQEMKDDEHR